MSLLKKVMELTKYNEKEARALIMSGKVMINNEVCIISSTKVKDNDQIRIKEIKEWVSRGAYKLLDAIEQFNIEIKDKICLDVGSSTGGFTEVLLKNGAKKIYALDSGTNQLDFKLRKNEKIVSLERTNLKSINKDMFSELIDVVTCDVSFISVKHLFTVLDNENILSENNILMILIKPQFEASSNLVNKGGYVDSKYHDKIIDDIINFANEKKFTFLKAKESPIVGGKSKNIEYLSLFERKNHESR